LAKGARDHVWNFANVTCFVSRNADSVIELEDDGLLFVKPYDTEEPFNKVIEKIQEQEADRSKGGKHTPKIPLNECRS
jgi:jumonji domain-containing protein 7